jgi:protein-L-isoaspartate(D-aspartate) O-methyltransferase
MRGNDPPGFGLASDDVTARVAAAFAAVTRAEFLPRLERRHAARDRPIPIGHEQTNSQPTTVRNMLTLLEVHPGDVVLDVGSGSGWTTGLLAELTGPTGRVYGVELVPELAEFGESNLSARESPWASISVAQPGVLGLPEHAPFDRILVSAEARELPEALVDQLGRGGRMVVPVAGRLSVVNRNLDGQVAVRRVGHYAFVPLR